MKNVIFALITIFFLVNSAVAEIDPNKEETIKKFSQALKLKDEIAINKSWQDINKDIATKEYMKENHPKVYHAFEMRGVVNRLHVLQVRYLNNATLPESVVASTPSKVETKDNSDAVSNSRPQPTNNDIARHYPNQSRTSNSDLVQASPNQSRTSNQDLIRSRLRNR